MKGGIYMKILKNPDSTYYEWLKNIPSGECFRNIQNGCIYMKTQSTKDEYELGSPDEICSYGCVNLSSGMIIYIADEKVIPINAAVLINYNSEKNEEALDQIK